MAAKYFKLTFKEENQTLRKLLNSKVEVYRYKNSKNALERISGKDFVLNLSAKHDISLDCYSGYRVLLRIPTHKYEFDLGDLMSTANGATVNCNFTPYYR